MPSPNLLAGRSNKFPKSTVSEAPSSFPNRFTMPLAATTGGADEVVPPDSVLRLIENLRGRNEQFSACIAPTAGIAPRTKIPSRPLNSCLTRRAKAPLADVVFAANRKVLGCLLSSGASQEYAFRRSLRLAILRDLLYDPRRPNKPCEWTVPASRKTKRCGCRCAHSGALAMIVAVGCGTTKTRLATEQLLVSDAVDQAVADIDFTRNGGTESLLRRAIYQ